MKRKEMIIGLMLALVIAVFLSPWASSWPDGLERVAHNLGFVERGEQSPVAKAPMPDYIFPGLKNEKLATAIAGLAGTVMIFGIVYGLAFLLKKKKD